MNSSTYKSRFVVLEDSGRLSYYEDTHSLAQPRGAIDCKNITSINLSIHSGRGNDIGIEIVNYMINYYYFCYYY